jgi:ribonuclease III
VAAFSDEIAIASERLLDFKSALQERMARNGARVRYDVTGEAGPPHDRVFEVAASVNGEVLGTGSGRSKKAAEQAAAEEALEGLRK